MRGKILAAGLVFGLVGAAKADPLVLLDNGFRPVPMGMLAGALGGLVGGGFSLAPGVNYGTSGALVAPAANANTLAIVNCASTCAMTLSAGVTDRQPYYIKRYGAGTVTVTANIDGTSGTTLTANSTTLKEMLHLEWNAALGTWLVGA